MNGKYTGIWYRGCTIESSHEKKELEAFIFIDGADLAHGIVRLSGEELCHLALDEDEFERLIDDMNGLVANIMSEAEAKGMEVSDVTHLPKVSYYVMYCAPRYSVNGPFLKDLSLEAAIEAFNELPDVFEGEDRDALKVLGVAYLLPHVSSKGPRAYNVVSLSPGPMNSGGCDLLQETCTTPLFISDDYTKLMARYVPEVVHSVQTLETVFEDKLGIDEKGVGGIAEMSKIANEGSLPLSDEVDVRIANEVDRE